MLSVNVSVDNVKNFELQKKYPLIVLKFDPRHN